MKRITIILISVFTLFLFIIGLMFLIKIRKTEQGIIFNEFETSYIFLTSKITSNKRYSIFIDNKEYSTNIYKPISIGVGYVYATDLFLNIKEQEFKNISIYMDSIQLFYFLMKGK